MPQLDPEQWAEVRRLFERASALTPDQRPAFLERECPHEDLRREVQWLLEGLATGLEAVEAAIAAETAAVTRESDPDHRLIGVHLGPYKIEAVVGHGGMGAVYRASRDDGEFHQQVAIKLVRAAAQSPATLQRFKRERQILAQLAHPNIARLLDGGSTTDGVPYLVMEFIEGEPVTAWCERRNLTIPQRLELFLKVCEAVDFAHRNRIVHRDLKPGNILVTDAGLPKLLDFGIAKILEAEPSAAAGTTIGVRAMTPEYAAPEQVRGDPVSRAVDVYALGLILYELLSGHKAQQIPDPSPATVAKVICQTEPVSPAALKPELAGDLDNIIRMAIRKEAERRYSTVADLARDIQLHLEGRPVFARPDTTAYRVAKFLRRNRAAVAGALVTAVVFGGVATVYWLRTPGRAPRVIRVAQVTNSGHADLGGGLATDGTYLYFIWRDPGQWKLARVPVEGGTPEILATTLRIPEVFEVSPDRRSLLVSNGAGDDVPLWVVPTDGTPAHEVSGAAGHTAAWSPDGMSIVFARGRALFRVNRDSKGLTKILDSAGRIDRVRWSPTALRFSVMSPDAGVVTLMQAQADGSDLHPVLANSDAAKSTLEWDDNIGWTAGGKLYLFLARRKDIWSIWAVREAGGLPGFSARRPVLLHSTQSMTASPTPSPDGKRIYFIAGQGRRTLVRYNPARGEFVPFLAGKPARWMSFSRDGRWMTYTIAPAETLWKSRPDGTEAVQMSPPGMVVNEPQWSPDGAWLAFSASIPKQPFGIYVMPSAGGAPERLTPGAFDNFVSWSADGNSLLFNRAPDALADSRLYRMDWKTRRVSPIPGSDNLTRAAWSSDGRHIAATNGRLLRILDTQTNRWTTVAEGKGITPPRWSRSGKYVYYQSTFEPEEPIYRVPVDGGKPVLVVSSRQIPQSDLTGYALAGLAPDDTPVAAVVRMNSDIYALELELP